MIPHVDGPMPLYSEKKPFSLMVFLHAVKHTVVLFHLAQIGTKDRTDVDERIHKGIGDTTSSRTTGNLRRGAKFSDMARETVRHTRVRLHFTRNNPWIGILILDCKFDLLERSRDCLENGTRDTTGSKVDQRVLVFFCHQWP